MTAIDRSHPALRQPLFSPVAVICIIAFADTFGGLVQGIFPATLLLRSCMVLFLVVYVLGLSTARVGVKLLWFAVVGYFLTRMLIDYFIALDERVLSVEGGGTLKLLYFPLFYAYLFGQIERGRMTRYDLRKCMVVYGWLILASLLSGHVTGLGGVIEGRGADMEGGKGFMIGANEVGLMLILTAPFIGAEMIRRSRSVVVGALAQLAAFGLAGVYVFTKSSLIATLVSGFSVYRAFVNRGRGARILIWAVIAAVVLVLVRAIYANIEAIEAFALGTFFSALLNDGVVAFLFRGRQDYIAAIYPQLLNHGMNWLFFLFGAGEFFMRQVSVAPLMLAPGEGTTFEMDFFDVLGAYGLVGFALYALIVRTLLRESGPRRFPAEIMAALVGVIGHSFMAGHVLFSPQVTTLLALVLLYYRVPEGARDGGAPPLPYHH